MLGGAGPSKWPRIKFSFCLCGCVMVARIMFRLFCNVFLRRGNHTETLRVEYDPKVTNYSNILKVFWDGHDSTQRRTPQYKSAIFYHNDEQKRLAEESAKAEQNRLKKAIATDILPADAFYDAEE